MTFRRTHNPFSQKPACGLRSHLVALSATALVGGTSLSPLACGSKSGTVDAVTETGNPPFLDDAKLEVHASEGKLVVTASAGSVPGNANVRVTNETSGDSSRTTADADGAFEVELSGEPGDELSLEVSSDAKSQTFDVQAANAASPEPGDAASQCDELADAAQSRLDEALEAADTSCQRDADCVIAPGAPICGARCSAVAVSVAAQANLEAVQSAIEAEECQALEAAACFGELGCEPIDLFPNGVGCIDGQCGAKAFEPDPPGASAPDEPTQPVNPGGSLAIIVPPDEDGRLPGDLWIGCQYGPEFQAADLDEIVPLSEGDPGGVTEAIEPFLSSGEGQFWPQDDWMILRQTADEILLVHSDDTELAFMNVSQEDGEWTFSGSQTSNGPCPLYYLVPEGLNTVDWRLAPGEPSNANATTLDVVVSERECVSGQAIGDRLLGPQVVMTEGALRIAFAAEPPPGDAFDCPSNPETRVTVELPEPIGDREVIEGLAIGVDLEDFLP